MFTRASSSWAELIRATVLRVGAQGCRPITKLVVTMMRRVLAIALLGPMGVLAYDPDRARTNIAHEFAECAAYFRFVSGAPGLDSNTASGLKKRGEFAGEVSAQFSTPELALARVDLALKALVRETKGSWENISIINNKYGYPCSDLMKDPEARLRYWLEKKD